MTITVYTGILAVLVFTCSGKVFEGKCTIDKTSGDVTAPIEGTLALTYDDATGVTKITGKITGFNKTDNITDHGFHIHEFGLLTKACGDAGGHFNPTNKDHGGPTAADRHIGDLGNVKENAQGEVNVDITDSIAKLDGTNNVNGKAIVVHAKADDFESQPTGDAGGRLGCCIITVDSGVSGVNYSFASMVAVLATYFLFLR